MSLVRNADENKLADMHPEFNDARLDKLLLLYKARQFPKSLTGDEQKTWQVYRSHKLLDGDKTGTLTKYFERINGLASNQELSQAQSFLLEELKLYGESIMPYDI